MLTPSLPQLKNKTTKLNLKDDKRSTCDAAVCCIKCYHHYWYFDFCSVIHFEFVYFIRFFRQGPDLTSGRIGEASKEMQWSGQSRWTKFQFSELGGHPTSFLHICLSTTLELNVHWTRWNYNNFAIEKKTERKVYLAYGYFTFKGCISRYPSLVLLIGAY